METFVPMTQVVQPGAKGSAKVEHYTISQHDSQFSMIRSMANHDPYGYVSPGDYCRLVINGDLVMSDTRMEKETNRELTRRAHGDVLIAGLGIGMVLVPLVKNDDVKSITVVEQNQDVIDLVSPHFTVTAPYWVESKQAYKLHKLSILCGDILTWNPEEALGHRPTYDVIYFDIWPDKCIDNLEEMTKLKRRYRKYLVKGGAGWMACWSQDELRYHKRRENLRKLRGSMW
jgi:spermidine synthase